VGLHGERHRTLRDHPLQRTQKAGCLTYVGAEGFDVEFFLRWKGGQEQRVRVASERFEAGESAELILTTLALNYVWLGHSILVDASGKIVLETHPEDGLP
jgi:hypothetical protein